jgi:CheY-like chemotaxis protein
MITYRPIVLVCEDCDEDFDTLKDAARTAGVAADLRRATTGDACLTLLRGNGGEPAHPAVVLLDLNTPGTDGREALKEIKEDMALRHLPVVVLTTSANPRDMAFCYHAGANAYHVKPIRYADHIQVLLDVFTYWLGTVALPDQERGRP